MDIDLLFTREGEAGLIANESPVAKVMGAVFDSQTALLTLEFTDMNFLEMNIPLDIEYHPALQRLDLIHFGSVRDKNIAQAYQIPIMLQDDPYRGQVPQDAQQLQKPLFSFEHFIKKCVRGQAVHRADLSNDSVTCVLGDAVPASLQFAPHLAKRLAAEASPQATPKGPGPSTPGRSL